MNQFALADEHIHIDANKDNFCDECNSELYVERSWDEESKQIVEKLAKIPDDAIEITQGTQKILGGKWYYVQGKVNYNKRLEIGGSGTNPCHIILKDGCVINTANVYVYGSSFDIMLNGKHEGTGIVMIALYDSINKNKLIDVKYFDLEQGANPKGSFSQSGYFKAFWWSDTETMTPLCNSVDGTIHN